MGTLSAGLNANSKISPEHLVEDNTALTNKTVQEVVEYWETWSALSGTRERLDQNISERTEKWFNWIDSPTGFVVTIGVYFQNIFLN